MCILVFELKTFKKKRYSQQSKSLFFGHLLMKVQHTGLSKVVKSCHSSTTILYEGQKMLKVVIQQEQYCDGQKTCLVFDLAFESGISLKS